jgi:SAM-dependent methyltransferase
MLERSHEYDKMADVEQRHWWYVALHHLVVDALRRYLPDGGEIVDAGCGTGGLMLFLRAQGHSSLRGFDLSEDAVRHCQDRGLEVVQDDLLNIASRHPSGSAGAVVSNDTLYFLDPPDQRLFVAACHEVLRPNGVLIVNVPALKAFAGIHDLSVGITRRFTRRAVHDLLTPDQFTILRETYWPFFLSPALYLVRLAQRIRMKRTTSVEVRSDIDMPPTPINAVLGGLTRLENRIARVKPWGSSLFVVARRVGGDD